MTETTDITTKARKPIAWWKAGLLGMVVSTISLVAYLIIGNAIEWAFADTGDVNEWLLIVALIVPTIIYTILFTARNSDVPTNRLATIAVSIMTATPPACLVYNVSLAVADFFFGSSRRWDWDQIQQVIIFLVTVYAAATILATAAWLILGRKHR